jgi:hypothetical protein
MAYDQNIFLGLAAKGKDEWNKWRQANKGVRVTFAGIDFSKAPRDEIEFSGFEFGDHADFSGCKWRGGVWQEIEEPEPFLPGRAFFTGAAFGHEAKFTGAAFGDQAKFTRATFRQGSVEFTGQSEEQWTNRLKAKLVPWDEKAFKAFKHRYEQSRTHDESGFCRGAIRWRGHLQRPIVRVASDFYRYTFL